MGGSREEELYGLGTNGSGAVISSDNYTDSYAALNGGWPTCYLYAITGTNSDHVGVSTSTLGADFDRGQYVVLCTTDPSDSQIVGNHCYAKVVGYNLSSSRARSARSTPGASRKATLNAHGSVLPASTVADNFSSEVPAGSAMHQEAAISAENAILATDAETIGEHRPATHPCQVIEVGNTMKPIRTASGWSRFSNPRL